ncbi:MAG: hypothetical protein IKB38_07100 [Clostridia bacterium]|nr:hypothetical protein [Clostridia bacterium]
MHTFKICMTVFTVVLLCLFIALALVNGVFHLVYHDFYKNAERDFKIPGLNSGFVPQGIEETPSGILISGYMTKDRASRIYVLKDGDASAVELFNPDGTPYTGHAGGIDAYFNTVFITGDMTTEVLSLSDLTDGDGKAKVIGSFDPGLDPAWCTVWGKYILMGSFANSESDDYPPDAGEIFTTPSGDRNTSLIKAFRLNSSFPLGIDPTPAFAISSGEKVQGLSFVDDKTLVLSTSYGLGSSKLIFHSVDKMKEKSGSYSLSDGTTVPLYYLDKESETRSVKAPPMSEELMIKDGYIYVLNESACNKYVFGKLLGQYRIYRYKI